MSWICDYCSSCNSDSDLVCIVCDAHRSEASIREAKRIEREKRREQNKEKAYAGVLTAAKILFFAGITMFFLSATIAVIMKVIRGGLNEIPASLITVGEHFFENVCDIYKVNCLIIFEKLKRIDVSFVTENLEFLLTAMGDKIDYVTGSYFGHLVSEIALKFGDVGIMIRSVFDIWAEKIALQSEALVESGKNVLRKISASQEAVVRIFENAKENVDQLRN